MPECIQPEMFSSEKETRCPKKTRCPKVGQMPETGQMPQSGPDAPTRTHYASFIVLSKTVLCILSKLHFLNSVTHLGCLFEFNTEYRLMWKHRPFTPNHTDSQLTTKKAKGSLKRRNPVCTLTTDKRWVLQRFADQCYSASWTVLPASAYTIEHQSVLVCAVITR